MLFQCPTKLWRLTDTLNRAGKAYHMPRQYTAYLRKLATAVHKEAYGLGSSPPAGEIPRREAARMSGNDRDNITWVPLYDLPQLSDVRRQEYTEAQREGREAHDPPDSEQSPLPAVR